MRIGDLVTIDDVTGTVEEIRPVYTFIRTADNRRVLIPNEQLTSKIIHNYSLVDETSSAGFDFEVPVTAPLPQVAGAVLDVLRGTEGGLPGREPESRGYVRHGGRGAPARHRVGARPDDCGRHGRAGAARRLLSSCRRPACWAPQRRPARDLRRGQSGRRRRAGRRGQVPRPRAAQSEAAVAERKVPVVVATSASAELRIAAPGADRGGRLARSACSPSPSPRRRSSASPVRSGRDASRPAQRSSRRLRMAVQSVGALGRLLVHQDRPVRLQQRRRHGRVLPALPAVAARRGLHLRWQPGGRRHRHLARLLRRCGRGALPAGRPGLWRAHGLPRHPVSLDLPDRLLLSGRVRRVALPAHGVALHLLVPHRSLASRRPGRLAGCSDPQHRGPADRADGGDVLAGHRLALAAPGHTGPPPLMLAPEGILLWMAYLALAFGNPLLFLSSQSQWHRGLATPNYVLWRGLESVVQGLRQLFSGQSAHLYWPVEGQRLAVRAGKREHHGVSDHRGGRRAPALRGPPPAALVHLVEPAGDRVPAALPEHLPAALLHAALRAGRFPHLHRAGAVHRPAPASAPRGGDRLIGRAGGTDGAVRDLRLGGLKTGSRRAVLTAPPPLPIATPFAYDAAANQLMARGCSAQREAGASPARSRRCNRLPSSRSSLGESLGCVAWEGSDGGIVRPGARKPSEPPCEAASHADGVLSARAG